MVGWICIHGRCQKTFVRPSQVIEVVEPIDIPNGWKPAGWFDNWAGAVRVSINGVIETIGFGPTDWPDVLVALGCCDGVTPDPLHVSVAEGK